MSKREGYISWDEYFLGLAFLSAQRSKDPNTQVGACIVKDQKIVGIGYNGFPKGSDDDEMSWEREGDPLNTKYFYVVHAELNAILNSIRDLRGSTIYVTLYPCNECAKAIAQSGITEVVYFSDKYKESDICKASTRIMQNAGIKLRKYEGKARILLEFKD